MKNGNGSNGARALVRLMASAFLTKGPQDEQGRDTVRKDGQGNWLDQVLALFERNDGNGPYVTGVVGRTSVAIRPVYGLFTIPPKGEDDRRDYSQEKLVGIYEEVFPRGGGKPFGKAILLGRNGQVKPGCVLMRASLAETFHAAAEASGVDLDSLPDGDFAGPGVDLEPDPEEVYAAGEPPF